MKKYIAILIGLLLMACVEDLDHKSIDTTIVNPNIEGKVELTFKELFNLHSNEIGKDTIVTGYVVSSDNEGNFYKEIFVQNTLGTTDLSDENPRMGLRVRLGLRATGIKYALGRKIAINLEGLKRTTSDNVITLGTPSGTFIKDILEFDVANHILKFDEVGELNPKIVAISDLKEQDLNTLVQIENVHFNLSEFGKPLAGLETDDFDGKRTLEFCEPFRKDALLLETSNFADFADNEVPESQLNVTGIYTVNFDKEPVLVLNKFEGLKEVGAFSSCNVQTPNVFITEVADPKNAANARFVELYNAEDVAVELKGWKINRFNNGDNQAIEVPLDGVTIPAKGFVIVANNEENEEANNNFENAFGFQADLVNTKIDGNGNDAYSLTNEAGELVDVFGNPSENGTDTAWEYTDGRAYRNINVQEPNPIFLLTEWTIVKGGVVAPDDFSPKERKTTEVPISVVTAPLLITEVADPKANSKARFVEIYNPTNNNIRLKDWTLVRYNYTASKNTKELAALPILLDVLTVPAKGFVVVTRDQTEFNTYFGVAASMSSAKLDGNGDDAYELIDPFNTLIDVYGDATTEGSGSNWEYTDGYAQRNSNVTMPNSEFVFSEWTVKEDVSTAIEFTPFQQ